MLKCCWVVLKLNSHAGNTLYWQGRRNDFDIGEVCLTSAKGTSAKGVSTMGLGGLHRENFEIYDTCRCILSHCWNILFSFFYREFVSFKRSRCILNVIGTV